MSVHIFTPKPDFERYIVQVGWNPHRTYFRDRRRLRLGPGHRPRQHDTVRIGLVETILDPVEVLLAVEPYADIPADLAAALHADQAAHPVLR